MTFCHQCLKYKHTMLAFSLIRELFATSAKQSHGLASPPHPCSLAFHIPSTYILTPRRPIASPRHLTAHRTRLRSPHRRLRLPTPHAVDTGCFFKKSPRRENIFSTLEKNFQRLKKFFQGMKKNFQALEKNLHGVRENLHGMDFSLHLFPFALGAGHFGRMATPFAPNGMPQPHHKGAWLGQRQ